MDVIISSLCIVILLPVILLIVLVLRVCYGPGVTYAHRRVGRHGVPFHCYKFRSMKPRGDEILSEFLSANPEAAAEWQRTRKLKNDPRVTPIGRILRQTSLDELPQLFNILAGQMSCVGPRPIMFDELQRYGAAAREYFAVRPGLTGLWQVSGRSRLSYEERVAFDRHYVQNRSIPFDLFILARTIPAVARRTQTS